MLSYVVPNLSYRHADEFVHNREHNRQMVSGNVTLSTILLLEQF